MYTRLLTRLPWGTFSATHHEYRSRDAVLMVHVGKYSIRGAFGIHICPHIFFIFFNFSMDLILDRCFRVEWFCLLTSNILRWFGHRRVNGRENKVFKTLQRCFSQHLWSWGARKDDSCQYFLSFFYSSKRRMMLNHHSFLSYGGVHIWVKTLAGWVAPWHELLSSEK